VTKFYNKLSKITFFIFLFLFTPSKQLFAETITGDKLEKFIIENTIIYQNHDGYILQISFDDNPKTFRVEAYNSLRGKKLGTYRGSWNFVNSKTAVFLPEPIKPPDQFIFPAAIPTGTFQLDNKFITFKGPNAWQVQYSVFNTAAEYQKQAEIRRQEEIKKEQDRIKAEQLKKEAETKAAFAKKQADELAAIAKKAAEEERQARLKQQQEAERREAIINGFKLVALFTFIAAVFFYLYKFQKNNIIQLYSKLKMKKKSSLQKNLDKQKSPKNPNEDLFDWKTTQGKIFLSLAAILSIWIIYMYFFGYSGGTKGKLIIERPYGQGAFGPTNIECVYEMWESKERVAHYLPYGSSGGCPKYLE